MRTATTAPGTESSASTVDAVDSQAGAVVGVRALVAEADGRTGHWGGAEAPDGVLPPS